MTGLTLPRLQRNRVDWIDVAKGLGIILVVIGHVDLPLLNDWVYRFHMPMFFMLSGMVFRPGAPKDFVTKRIRSLLIPYVAFVVLVTLVDNLAGLLAHARVEDVVLYDLRRIPRDLFGGRRFGAEYGAMWFITCLFVSILVYNGLRRRLANVRGAPLIVIMSSLFLLSYLIAPISLPWDVALTPMAIVFIWLGELWMTSFGDMELMLALRSPATLVALLLAVISCFVAASLDMKFGDLGTPFISVIAAAAWSHIILLCCRGLAQLRLVKGALIPLGQASIVILFTHRLLTDRFLEHLYPPLLVAVAVILPFLLYLALKASGPVGRLLFLGEPLPARQAVLLHGTASGKR